MEIISRNIDLINTCVDCQFAKYKDLQFKEDMRSDLIIILNNYDNEKLNQIEEENHLNAFITGILIRQLWSNGSDFYKTYYRLQNRCDTLDGITEKDNGDDDRD